ncbi:cadherin-like beta sandwich domain-containing protein [Saccharibacillus sp. CPCC 101409]|uniref:cadherin-like beta sandwich domain-containing protein n=1 Tax=Saccharibacillus sp. CPCC 101409 TaxID=3058041 RepID=UPI002673E042|nr:cadherin-like beta sandwich domain-containing protein [Saccharibacillus sp. CPCC 101409]MDO3411139.1 cadherin-like beta sandwich domain-containing protein [Saccharibacillus sp. CPCC 101409]
MPAHRSVRSLYRFTSFLLSFLLVFASFAWLGAPPVSAASTWTKLPATTSGADIAKAVYGNGQWIAPEYNGKILVSSDAVTWTERTIDAAYGAQLYDVVYAGGQWVVVGADGAIYTSSDSVAWTSRGPNTSGRNISAVTYANSTYVAVGNKGDIFYSANGAIWTKTSAGAKDFLGIAYGNSLFAAVGEGGAIYSSPDAQTWTQRGAQTEYLYTVAYLNGAFYATKDGGIYTSSNGTSWTAQDISEASNALLYGIAYAGGRYVLAGAGGLILSSTNGTSWSIETSGTTNDLYGAGASSGKFVAVGANGTIVTRDTSGSLSTDSALASLAISAGTLTPSFTSGNTSYTASVSSATTSITVTPTTANANATVTVNTTTTASGSASGPIPLAPGNNTIETIVTAQDGTTKTTYTITVNRAAPASSDTKLSGLAVDQGSLSPAFASETTSYWVNVDNSVTDINVTPTVNQSGATVTVKGAAAASGSAQKVSLTVGNTSIPIVVTAEDGSKRTYTLNVNRAFSANADLSALSASTGTLFPPFASNKTSYTINVPNSVDSIAFTPTAADSSATITVNGRDTTSGNSSANIQLTVGVTTIQIKVTAQDQTTTKSYAVNVVRPQSSNADLSSLTVSSGTLSPKFASGTTSYTVDVPNTTTGITVTPTAAEANATVKVNGTPVTSGSASGPIPLAAGANTVEVVVTAQNNTTKTYILTVNQVSPSSNANLNGLTISKGALSPSFDKATTSYTATVDYTAGSIDITPTVSDPNAAVTVDGKTAASGSPSTVTLKTGSNPIEVKVTAPNGSAQTYTINVTLLQNPTLSGLTINPGTLTPAFDSDSAQYGAKVDYSVSAIQITPTAAGSPQTLTVAGTAAASGVASNVPLKTGVNTIEVVVTMSDGATKTYTLTITRGEIGDQQAVDADKASLQIGYAPGDNDSFVTQNLALPVSGANGTSIAWTSDRNESVGTDGTVRRGPYSEGDRSVELTATIKRGTAVEIRKFQVTVKALPASAAADLKALAINGQTLVPAFDRETRSYSLNVPYSTASVTVTASAYDPNAAFTIQGAAAADGSSSAPIALNVGGNAITVKVTAQDGTTQQTYTVNVTRAANTSTETGGGTGTGGTGSTTPTPSVTTLAPSASNPVPSASGGFEIRVNGRPVEQIATGSPTQTGGQNTFNAVIDTGKLSSLLAAESSSPLVVVPVTTEADKVSTRLTGEAVQLLQERAATLRVETTLGNYTLPASELRLAQLGGTVGGNADSEQLNVVITVQRSDDAAVSALNKRAAAEGFSVVQAPVDFNIAASYGGQTIELNTFSDYVERELPVPAGYDPNRITTAVVIEADGSLRHVPTAITRANQDYFAKVNSLTNSDYALIWSPKEFSDVAGLWSQSAVNDMASRQIVDGVDASRFDPSGSVTRAEFAAILVRALGLPDNETSSTFRDVPSGEWYTGSVAKAAQYGLIDGYADGTFRPQAAISRQEAFAILGRAAKIAKPASTSGGTSLSDYSDAARVGSWARDAVQAVLAADLVQGSGGRLKPLSPLSRAETAAAVQRLLQKSGLID